MLQNINWDPSAPVRMQTNSIYTDGGIYTATYAGKLTHTDIFIHSYTQGDTHIHWWQGPDRCDCSDNRNRATSGLTVIYICRYIPGVVPGNTLTVLLFPPTKTKDTAPMCCMCVNVLVGTMLSQFSSSSRPGQSVTFLTAKLRVWPKRRDPFSLLLAAKREGKWE